MYVQLRGRVSKKKAAREVSAGRWTDGMLYCRPSRRDPSWSSHVLPNARLLLLPYDIFNNLSLHNLLSIHADLTGLAACASGGEIKALKSGTLTFAQVKSG